MIHFEQWKKASWTSTANAKLDVLPRAAIDSSRSASRTILALPLTRSVSLFPGTTKIRPTFGFSRTFVNVSARRFPGRSGIASVESSRTRTKPQASPFGEISISPRVFEEAIRTKGDLAINARQCRSRTAMVLATQAGGGSPIKELSWVDNYVPKMHHEPSMAFVPMLSLNCHRIA